MPSRRGSRRTADGTCTHRRNAPDADALKDFLRARTKLTLADPGRISSGDQLVGFFPLLPKAHAQHWRGAADRLPGVDGVASGLLRAYAVMVATSVLNAVKKANAGASPSIMTLKAAYAASGFSVIDAVGMATRFMLHGSRHQLADGTLGALYRATGQDR